MAADALAASLQAVLTGFQNQLNADHDERASKKPPTFETGDPIDWMTFRRNFEITITINGWPNNRCRRELAGALTGRAARAVAGIAVEVVAGQVPIPYETLVQQYQDIFLPAAASDLAVAQFEKCRQWSDEELLVWHSRCRDLFSRAYPTEPTEDSRRLIAAFSQGLASREVKEFVYTHRPQTFGAALTTAQNREATLSCMVDMGPAPTTAEGTGATAKIAAMGGEYGLYAMKPAGSATVQCWHCEEKGHVQRRCPALIKTAKTLGIDIGEVLKQAAAAKKEKGGKTFQKPRYNNFKKKVGAMGDGAEGSAPENQ